MKTTLLMAAAAICLLGSYLNSASQETATSPGHFVATTLQDTVPGHPSDSNKKPIPDTSRMPKMSLDGINK